MSKIQVGDIVRSQYNGHTTYCVTEIDGEYCTVKVVQWDGNPNDIDEEMADLIGRTHTDIGLDYLYKVDHA